MLQAGSILAFVGLLTCAIVLTAVAWSFSDQSVIDADLPQDDVHQAT